MITIQNLTLTFPGFTLGPVSLDMAQGEFFALMGPTGSGKTLLLETVAGLLRPRSGSVLMAGRDITHAAPEARGVGLVYQDHALFPQLTVMENITFGQRYHRIPRREGERYAGQLMEMLDLSRQADRLPETLSGGEKQRTALARALACRPQVLLLDEPLSSLDPQFREGLRTNLKELHQASGSTFFMVTHDFVDAWSLADRAAVIRKGRIEQTGPTRDIFHRPATAFIADFVGMRNIFAARAADGLCHFAGLEAELGTPHGQQENGFVALRPEDVHVLAGNGVPPGWLSLSGILSGVTREGFSWLATVDCRGERFMARLEHRLLLDADLEPGSLVTLAFDPASTHFFPG